MDTLATQRDDYKKLLEESVKILVDRLRTLGQVQRISLFGSYAQGRRDLLTDLDILVVMETSDPFIERLRQLYELLALPVDADILCYTPEEFSALKDNGWLRHALQGELVLYEKKPT